MSLSGCHHFSLCLLRASSSGFTLKARLDLLELGLMAEVSNCVLPSLPGILGLLWFGDAML